MAPAASASPGTTAGVAPRAAADCGPVSPKLVPGCGAWFGIATTPQDYQRLSHVEALIGRTFDMVYDFHAVGDALPTAGERRLVREGRMLHVNIESTKLSYAQIAAGAADSELTTQAHGLQSLGVPVLINFDHEPDARKKDGRGTPAEFVAAYRHVHDVFAAAGAANAVWAWVTTGYSGNFDRLLSFYPGNDDVDWISWEAYTGVKCPSPSTLSASASFYKNVQPMYKWLHTTGAAGGIDVTKPIIISEYDAVYNTADPSVTANWYRGMVPAIKTSFPGIKAIQKWDVPGGNCRYSTDTDPQITAAIKVAGANPYVNQPRAR